MENSIKRRTYNRYILVFYFFILCVHFVVHNFAIIYPSLVFPAFSEAPKIEKTVDVKMTELYGIAGRRFVKLSEQDFFQNINSRHSYFILNAFAKKADKVDHMQIRKQREVFKKYAQNQLHRMYPHLHFDAMVLNQTIRQFNVATKKLEGKEINGKRIFIPLT